MTIKHNPFNFKRGYGTQEERITMGVPTITTDHAAIHEKQAFTVANKMTIASGKVGAISIRPPTDVAASYTFNMTNALADLTYTAKEVGYDGNDITITHVDPSGNNQPLSVSVSGTDITVNLATGAGGAITSTAALVKAAINANIEASELVLCEDEGVGSGIVNATVKTNLTGGSLKSYVHFKPATFSNSAGPIYISLIEDATFTGNSSTVTPVNRNRHGMDVPSRVPCSATVDATVVNGANALTLSNVSLFGSSAGASRMGGSSNLSDEWVLDPGVNYLMVFSNATSPGVEAILAYDLFWYEEMAA